MQKTISFPGGTTETVYWTFHATHDHSKDAFYVYMDGKKVYENNEVENMIELMYEFGKALRDEEVDY